MNVRGTFRSCPLFLCLAMLASAAAGFGQDGALPDAPKAPPDAQAYAFDGATLGSLLRNVVHDQGSIWTSPLRMRAHDLKWLLPLGAAAGIAIATDEHTMRDVVTHDPNINNNATTASNVAIGGLIATPVAIYGYGFMKHDDHARETGFLASEAMVDGVVVEQGMKLMFWRERPYMDQGRGRFWQPGVGIDSSFPSSHAVISWSAASVIASEYPRPLVEVAAYGTATGICMARMLGQQHFPGDLLVGSAAGWLVGRYVYNRHHHYDGRGHRIEHALLQAATLMHSPRGGVS